MSDLACPIDHGRVDRAVRSAMTPWKCPGTAVAVVYGEDAYLQGYGVRELGGADPVTPDTVFAIASTSKAFTTTAIAMLVDEGRMAWDEHVRAYLPWFHLSDPSADSVITIRDLVCHRSGMPRHDLLWYALDSSREECVRRFCRAKHSTSVRSTYEYSNIPFMAAGLALEAVSGMSWEDFIRQRIFEPLGMSTASTSVARAQSLADHASPHEKHKGKLIVIPWLVMDKEGPAGGINASARDLLAWLRFQIGEGEFDGKRLLSREALLETRKPQIVIPTENHDRNGLDFGVNLSSYCLGWNMHDYRGYTVCDHGGLIDGFTAQVALAPRQKIGVAVLANTTAGPVVQAALRGIMDSLLGLPRWNWPALYREKAAADKAEARRKKAEEREKHPRRPRTRPSRELSAFAGQYENAAYGTLEIELEGGKLWARYGRLRVPLKHHHFDVFTYKVDQPGWQVEGKLQFLLDVHGEPSAVRSEGMLIAEFTRKPSGEVKPSEG